MFDFLKIYQLDIMLYLCATSTIMAVLLFITRFLPRRRKWILIGMELNATLLLGFDRLAYIYSGNLGAVGYVMVRLSNFIVFFMTSGIVFCFNLYISDLIESKVGKDFSSIRLKIVSVATVIGMLLAVLTVFTGLYYYFDSHNHYHRGNGFLLAYVIPVLGPLIQFSVIYKHRKQFSRFIYIALLLYIFVPIFMGILQIFAYGVSIVNMAMVLVSVSLYIFTYLDINDEIQHAHYLEMEVLKEEQKNMKTVFSQTATAFVEALEAGNDLYKGHSELAAETALKIAKECGKSEQVCNEAYYTALLHNAGLAGLPENLISKEENITGEEEKLIKKLPVLSAKILSRIKAFPYLSNNARYVYERYDGKGYPEGLKGESIPEVARIVAVAEEYATVTSRNKYRDAIPAALVREEFVKEGGLRFDPAFSSAMVRLMDTDTKEHKNDNDETLESELVCGQYRDRVSVGVPVSSNYVNITFKCRVNDEKGKFSLPSIILYDSFDRHVYSSQKLIESYHYLEYGEVWFDGHVISTSARNMKVSIAEKEKTEDDKGFYKISSARFDDHLILKMESYEKHVEVIIALPDISKASYISLTGENCILSDIKMEVTDEKVFENSIPRIAEPISYINHIESDVPNIQINTPCGEYTQGIEINDGMTLSFHTMTLPDANLVWHCPYVLLYYSEDGKVDGKDYRQYAFFKLNGEDNGSNEYAENDFSMHHSENFENWRKWNDLNKAGYECKIKFTKKGGRISIRTENLGIAIENITKIKDEKDSVYISLTGDQCALTDIRIY
ncbi:HD-GYP domain-containing protein [Treponema sp. C6A8]|uniref:HD-GYP domain-containing protein n=1 Tax=Treponema sp. C6A8 TaxID=1410609 RepID=UPI00048445E8|nr:HD domain-containing phosphohydrolase [Treponema sp. C6A8]